MDFDEHSEADFVLDMNKDQLPFEDSSFDLVILSEVLEHLYNPFNAINEAVRVLRKDGLLYVSTPFVFHYHGTPYDFYRYTEFFYKKISEELSLEMVETKKGCSFFTTPVFTTNILIDNIFSKFKCKAFSYPLLTFLNILTFAIDSILLKFGEKLGIREKMQYMNCGIALIFKKKCVE